MTEEENSFRNRIRAYREKNGVGFYTARKAVIEEILHEDLEKESVNAIR